MNNLENHIKDEYVIVFAERFGSGTTYYIYNEKDTKMDKNNPFFIAYGNGTKYASRETAEKKLNELISNNFFTNCSCKVCRNVVEENNLDKSVIKAWYGNDYSKTSAIAVVKIPISHYLGKYGAYAFELNKLNIPYDNDHRYQCASHRDGRWLYLKVNTDNITEWVESQDKATCMSKKEQEKWCDILNEIKPFKGYVQAMNLPVRLNTQQKYYKGQKVLIYENGNYFYTHISDVMPDIDGKYHYALPSDSIYGGRVCMTSEGFYEGDDLYPEDRIIPFDNMVKSFRIKETQYNTYYTNVIMCDGTKIDEIRHF